MSVFPLPYTGSRREDVLALIRRFDEWDLTMGEVIDLAQEMIREAGSHREFPQVALTQAFTAGWTTGHDACQIIPYARVVALMPGVVVVESMMPGGADARHHRSGRLTRIGCNNNASYYLDVQSLRIARMPGKDNEHETVIEQGAFSEQFRRAYPHLGGPRGREAVGWMAYKRTTMQCTDGSDAIGCALLPLEWRSLMTLLNQFLPDIEL